MSYAQVFHLRHFENGPPEPHCYCSVLYFYCQDFPFFFRGCEVINYYLGYAVCFFQPLIAYVFLLCIPHSIKQEPEKNLKGKQSSGFSLKTFKVGTH